MNSSVAFQNFPVASSVHSEAQLKLLVEGIICWSSDFSSDHPRNFVLRELLSFEERRRIAVELENGTDVLGEIYCKVRSPRHRRKSGATLTPPAVVLRMMEWLKAFKNSPSRIVDVGAGSGRFTIAAAKAFPSAQIVAVEKDRHLAQLLRANLALSGLSDGAEIVLDDYRSLKLPEIEGPTVFLGNPPYVRHHDIPREWKEWYAGVMARHGIKASRLAGLHLHFFAKTLEIAKSGDFGCLITAAEWLDVNYGSALRESLLGKLGLRSIDVIDPKFRVFEDALTSAAITTFEVGRPVNFVNMRWSKSIAANRSLGSGRAIPVTSLTNSTKWGPIIRNGRKKQTESQFKVGHLFRVRRGQVTGNNAVWVVDHDNENLPERILAPAITRARELFNSEGVLTEVDNLKRVVDIPPDYSTFPDDDKQAIEAFLARARRLQAHKSYIASHRKPWFSVKMYDPAPILCTYMARRPPIFVANACGARHLNIAHGLYPKIPLDNQLIIEISRRLTASVDVDAGRTYGGGLTKFEPREVEQLPLPALPAINKLLGHYDDFQQTQRPSPLV